MRDGELDVWECAPTTFRRAAIAWCAAAGVAGALYPARLEQMVRDHYQGAEWGEPLEGQDPLPALHEEAVRRADWVPAHHAEHCQPPRTAELGENCLLWRTSVDTLLTRTTDGWVVRITGAHDARQAAAEGSLAAEAE